MAGRLMNIMEDIFPHASERLMENVYRSPTNKTCFYSSCKKCFEEIRPYCGNPDDVEGSIAVHIPITEEVKMKVSGRSFSGFY